MEHQFTVTDKRGASWDVDPSDIPPASDEELLARQAAADDSNLQDPNALPVLTAFLVTIDHDGAVQASGELDMLERITISRAATFADMYAACAHVQKDIAGQEIALRTITVLQQQAQQSQHALQAAQLQQQMGRLRR